MCTMQYLFEATYVVTAVVVAACWLTHDPFCEGDIWSTNQMEYLKYVERTILTV